MTAQRTDAPIAVIDIGSNSIRLEIYASGGRYPFPLFNERSNCRLGEGLGDDGLLRADRIAVSLEALARFASIMKSMGVVKVHAVATAAVRRAVGCEFCAYAATVRVDWMTQCHGFSELLARLQQRARSGAGSAIGARKLTLVMLLDAS